MTNIYSSCIRLDDPIRFVLWRLHFKIFGRGGCRNFVDFLSSKVVSESYISEINSMASRTMLQDLQPDIILFAPFDKIAKSEFIAIPRLGTFNVHLGKLPEYLGGLSAF